MQPSNKSSQGKPLPKLPHLSESARSDQSPSELFKRLEEKFDRLSDILERGFSTVVASHSERIDHLSLIMNKVLLTNSKGFRKLNRTASSIEQLIQEARSSFLPGIKNMMLSEDMDAESIIGKSKLTEREASEVAEEAPETKIMVQIPAKVPINQQPVGSTVVSYPPPSQSIQLTDSHQFGEFKDRKLVVAFGQTIDGTTCDKGSALKAYAIKWIGKVAEVVVTESFKGYAQKQMSEADTKEFLCTNLLLNFVELLRKVDSVLGHEDTNQLISLFQGQVKSCLTYYLVKYPQKRKILVSQDDNNLIKEEFDRSSLEEFSMLKTLNAGLNPFKGVSSFELRAHPVPSDYSQQIKHFFNSLIRESKKHFQPFSNLMKEIFSPETGGEEIYHLIGMKFKQDMPQYTREELNAPGIPISSPEVLRIIIKWIEELDQMMLKPDTITKKAEMDLAVMAEVLARWKGQYLSELVDIVKEQADTQKQSASAIDRGILYSSAYRKLSSYTSKHREQFQALSNSAVDSGIAVSVVSQLTSHNAIAYLNGIIAFLYRVHKEAYIKREEKEGVCLLRPDEEVLRFSVMDLLRAKCSGTTKEVKRVLTRLEKDKRVKLLRCKNRLATGNRDFLINFCFEGCPLVCELQVGIKSAVDDKSVMQDHFNHFLYELARSKFGPLSECAIINSYQNDIGAYFTKHTKRLKDHKNVFQFHHDRDSDGSLAIEGFDRINELCVYMCSNCLEMSSTSTRLLGAWKKYGSDEFLCGSCIARQLTPQEQLGYLLGQEIAPMFQVGSWEEENKEPSDYLLYFDRKAPQGMVTYGTVGEFDESEVQPDSYEHRPIYYNCAARPVKLVDNQFLKKERFFAPKSGIISMLIANPYKFFKSKKGKSSRVRLGDLVLRPRLSTRITLPAVILEDQFTLVNWMDYSPQIDADQMGVVQAYGIGIFDLENKIIMLVDTTSTSNIAQSVAQKVTEKREPARIWCIKDNNQLTKLDIRHLSKGSLDTLQLTSNPQLELLIDDIQPYRIVSAEVGSTAWRRFVWAMECLKPQQQAQFVASFQQEFQSDEKQRFNTSNIYDALSSEKDVEKLQWTTMKLESYVGQNVLDQESLRKLRRALFPSSAPLKAYRVGNEGAQGQLVVDKRSVPMAEKCSDCGGTISVPQYYFFNANKHACIDCTEKLCQKGEKCAIPDAVLINCLNSLVDFKELETITQKMDRVCLDDELDCSRCRKTMKTWPQFRCLECPSRCDICYKCAFNERVGGPKPTNSTVRSHSKKHSLLRFPAEIADKKIP